MFAQLHKGPAARAIAPVIVAKPDKDKRRVQDNKKKPVQAYAIIQISKKYKINKSSGWG